MSSGCRASPAAGRSVAPWPSRPAGGGGLLPADHRQELDGGVAEIGDGQHDQAEDQGKDPGGQRPRASLRIAGTADHERVSQDEEHAREQDHPRTQRGPTRFTQRLPIGICRRNRDRPGFGRDPLRKRCHLGRTRGLVETIHHHVVALAELLDQFAARQRVDHLADPGLAFRAAGRRAVRQPHALTGIDQQQHAAVLDQLPFGAFFQVEEVEQDACQRQQTQRNQRPTEPPRQLDAVLAVHGDHVGQDRRADRRQHQPMPPLGHGLQASELIKRASRFLSQQRPRCGQFMGPSCFADRAQTYRIQNWPVNPDNSADRSNGQF